MWIFKRLKLWLKNQKKTKKTYFSNLNLCFEDHSIKNKNTKLTFWCFEDTTKTQFKMTFSFIFLPQRYFKFGFRTIHDFVWKPWDQFLIKVYLGLGNCKELMNILLKISSSHACYKPIQLHFELGFTRLLFFAETFGLNFSEWRPWEKFVSDLQIIYWGDLIWAE